MGCIAIGIRKSDFVAKTQFLRVNFCMCQRNWVFTTNEHFLTPLSLQPDGVNLWYFKLKSC